MRLGPASPPRPLNAYVSASSRGLAFEVARRLAAGGNNVALSSRSASRLAAARAEILAESPGSRVITVPADLSRAEDQERVLSTLEIEGFSPDVFVCSAGHPKTLHLTDLTRSDWQSDVEAILGQAVFATRTFAPAMAGRGYGRLVFLSAISAKTPSRDFFVSSVARSALFALSKIVGGQYADRGVAAFVVCLGYVDTPLVRNLALGRSPDAPGPGPDEGRPWAAAYEEWAAAIPAKRIGTPEELSGLVAFLASAEAEYLNGTVFSFSGGLDRGLV